MPAQSGEAQKTDLEVKTALPKLVSQLKSDTLIKAFKPNKVSEEVNKNKQGVTTKGNRKSTLSSNKPDWFNTLTNSLGQWPPAQLAI